MELDMDVLRSRLQNWMNRAVQDGDMPFGAVSVSQSGKELRVCSGIANDCTKKPALTTTLGRFFSMTKLVTSFAVVN